MIKALDDFMPNASVRGLASESSVTLSPPDDADLTPAQRVDDVPRALRALRAAVQEALQRHKRVGHQPALDQAR